MPRTNFRSARKLLSPTTLHIHVVRSCRFTLRHAFAFVLRIEYLYLLGNYLCHFPFSLFINFSRTLFPLLWIFDYFLPTNASQIHSHRKFAFRKKFPKRDESSFQTKREIIPDDFPFRLKCSYGKSSPHVNLILIKCTALPPSSSSAECPQFWWYFDEHRNIKRSLIHVLLSCLSQASYLCLFIRNIFSSRFLGLGLMVKLWLLLFLCESSAEKDFQKYMYYRNTEIHVHTCMYVHTEIHVLQKNRPLSTFLGRMLKNPECIYDSMSI